MARTIRPAKLRVGDVLLYHGTGWLSRMIRLFDGGEYSHASIWNGTRVLEAIPTGVTLNTLAKSIASAKYVDIYRYRDDQGSELGQPLPVEPVVARIDHYRQSADRYAYEQLLLLALLTRLRPPPQTEAPLLLRLIRNLVESATDLIQDLLTLGREPMICSELVHRCYKEAGPAYEILIRGADVAALLVSEAPAAELHHDSESALLDIATEQMLRQLESARQRRDAATATTIAAATAGPAPLSGTAAGPVAGQRTRAKERAPRAPRTPAADDDEILVAPAGPIPAGASPAGSPPAPSSPSAVIMAVSDFVSPRDLQYSPRLYRVGTLRA